MPRRMVITTIVAATFASASLAGAVSPSDIKFGEDGEVTESLTGVAGDPANGAKVYASKKIGNCVSCHVVSSNDVDFQGNVGPSLDGAGSRWEEAQLRGIVANAKKTFEGTVMPSFYKIDGYIRPGNAYTGKAPEGPLDPLLEAQQIEDVVAYLMTLKDE